MLAHNHGGILNLSELGRAFGVSDTAIRHYLEILESTFMITLLKPWSENLSTRQVKRPKVYFRDSGLLHAFLGIRTSSELSGHLKRGASWEGYVIHALMRGLKKPGRQFSFWATHGGAELDLLMLDGTKRVGFEVKYSDAPTLTESMKSAMSTLKLDELRVVYPGTENYLIHPRVRVCSLQDALN
jgi:predicted AAA+ superfamily ATPase